MDRKQVINTLEFDIIRKTGMAKQEDHACNNYE